MHVENQRNAISSGPRSLDEAFEISIANCCMPTPAFCPVGAHCPCCKEWTAISGPLGECVGDFAVAGSVASNLSACCYDFERTSASVCMGYR